MRSFFTVSSMSIVWILVVNPANTQVSSVKFTARVPVSPGLTNGSVYLAGSFNGWSAHDTLYKMNKEEDNLYSLVVPLFEGKVYKYKYTLGNWNAAEVQANDSNLANRQVYSRNGLVLYDTVARWKTPPPDQPKTLSPQLQKMVAIKDSAAVEVKSMLNELLVLLKEYNDNMLSSKPSERLHKKQKKQTVDILARVYGRIEEMIWQVGSSLAPDQKQKILTAIKNSKAPGDVVNTIKNAYAEVLK